MPELTSFQKLRSFFIFNIVLPLCTPFFCCGAPLTRLYDYWLFEWNQQRRVSSPAEHRRRVARVQEQVRAWNVQGRKTRMVTARAGWASLSMPGFSKREYSQIQIDDLNCVVEVDTARRVVVVEPGMMMGQLTSILIPMGWTIPVVPEFEVLTVGGLICGAGIESSSTNYGLFGDIPLQYEVVTSNGDVVTCSKDENSDLFYSIPWSHGTLGFLMSATIPLIPAKKYVQLEYYPTKSIAEARRLLESQDHEFVEGIMYARNRIVVTLGNLTDKADPERGLVNHITRWHKPFFYKHVESFLETEPRMDGKPHVEFYPLREYYHRHSRGLFWVIPLILPLMQNDLYRRFFGWFLPGNTKLGFRILYTLGLEKWVADSFHMNSVVQDFVIPMKHFEASVDFFHNLVEIYPLWLCPGKFFKRPTSTPCKNGESELYLDIGVYGDVHERKQAAFEVTKSIGEMEAFVLDRDGIQALYAISCLSREDFRRMFDMNYYDQVRVKYNCLDAFPDVYDKVSKHTRGISPA